MNKRQANRLLKLADTLRKPGVAQQYNHTLYCYVPYDEEDGRLKAIQGEKCGTQACASGWAQALWPKQFEHPYAAAMSRGAESWLGLTDEERKRIFYSDGGKNDLTAEQVANIIKGIVRKHHAGTA